MLENKHKPLIYKVLKCFCLIRMRNMPAYLSDNQLQ